MSPRPGVGEDLGYGLGGERGTLGGVEEMLGHAYDHAPPGDALSDEALAARAFRR